MSPTRSIPPPPRHPEARAYADQGRGAFRRPRCGHRGYRAGRGSAIIRVSCRVAEAPMTRTRRQEQSEWVSREAPPPDARARLAHSGEWVAWDRDMNRVVASGSDMEAARAEAVKAGVARPVMEWVPPTPVRPSDAG